MPRTRDTSYRYGARGTPRRQTEWIAATVNFTDFTAAQSRNLITFSQAALVDLVPFTIIRLVGLLTVAFDTNFITNQTIGGAVGMQVVNESARAVGVSAMATPFSDASDDVWFYHQFFSGIIDDRADSDILVSANQFVINSKAQRKVVDGQAIAFTAEGAGEPDGFDIAIGLRILCKLH